MEQQNNWPMMMGVGAIAFSALAAGLAVGPYFRGDGDGAPTPATVQQPATDQGGMALPDSGPDDRADGPDGPVTLSEDERLGDLLADMIAGFGTLKRRVDGLEGAGPDGGDAGGLTRLDPATGQEYRAVIVWVPEGMEDEAAVMLREAVLDRLAARAGADLPKRFRDALLRTRNAAGIKKVSVTRDLEAQWWTEVRTFAAVWGDRDPVVLDEFLALLAKHIVPMLVASRREFDDEMRAGTHTPVLYSPSPNLPPVQAELLDAWTAMRAALRDDWRAFVDELPFDVQARYLRWCSPFLKGE